MASPKAPGPGQLTHAQLEVVDAHFGKFPKASICPSCEAKHWVATGPVKIATWQENPAFGPMGAGSAGPFLYLTCANCFYVKTYLWRPILGDLPVEER